MMPPHGVNLPKNTDSRNKKGEKTVARALKGLPSDIYTKNIKCWLSMGHIMSLIGWEAGSGQCRIIAYGYVASKI